ncbi:MAG: restriction endonuclease subunit S [Anaerolineae bacterium]|nr:restriction endonuclease subunit S [Anaerolineae bacterium]MCO5188141.1 restriction endonuclease subunit S [Anaerolineae bacterium]MCO5193014.1 restriction endonuclease subunit S [Anaerolineae bacterium]
MGQSPPSSTYNEHGEGLPFYQGKTDFGFMYPSPRKYCAAPKKIAEVGDILISVRAPVGPVNKCRERSCIGRGVSAIRAKDIDRDFLYYNLIYLEDYIASQGTGSTFKAINKSRLQSIEVNTSEFELSEQRKIAYVLGTVQLAIEQQTQLIERTQELKRALMHKLFTEGTRGEAQKETEIGRVPQDWDIVPAGDVIVSSRYGLSKKGGDNGQYPILRMTNQVNGFISADNLQYVDLSDDEFEKTKVEQDDILFNRTNSFELVGRTAIFTLEGDYTFASYLIRIRVDTGRIDPYFLNNYLGSDVAQVRLKSIATRGVSQSNISATRLKGFLIPLPWFDEQCAINEKIRVVNKKVAIHQQKKRVLDELFRTLLHKLMTAQVRVHHLALPDEE